MILILRIARVLLRAFLELVMGVLIFIAFSPALVGIGIIGFQVFVWLATETWTPIPLSDAVEVLGVNPRSLDQSLSWHGLAEALRYALRAIPLSSCFLATGLLFSLFMGYVRRSLLDLLE